MVDDSDGHAYSRPMSFSSISILGVVLATLAAFAFNFVYFGPIGVFRMWWRAIGKTDDDVPGAGMNMPVVFGSTMAALVVEAVAIAAILGGLHDAASIGQGAALGLVVGIGVAATSSLGHRLFAGQGFRVWALEVGADIAVGVIMGVVLAAIG